MKKLTTAQIAVLIDVAEAAEIGSMRTAALQSAVEKLRENLRTSIIHDTNRRNARKRKEASDGSSTEVQKGV